MLKRIQCIFTRVPGIMDYTLTPKTKLNNRDMNIAVNGACKYETNGFVLDE